MPNDFVLTAVTGVQKLSSVTVEHVPRALSVPEPEHIAPFDLDQDHISGGTVGPSTGIASDMAYGAPSRVERALQFAAKTYMGDVRDWTDVMLVAGGGAMASLRVVGAARHVPRVVSRLENQTITNNYMDLLETYKRALKDLSDLHAAGAIGRASLEDFSRYVKEAFRQAFHNSIVPGVQADSAFRHATFLEEARKVPPAVAKQLSALVKAVCNKGNWRGKVKPLPGG